MRSTTSSRILDLRRSFIFFFFQAEDGIRDLTVTGVQTCALPIFRAAIVAHLFDDHAASELQVPLLFRSEIDDRETEAIGRLFRRLSAALAAARDPVLGQLPDRDGDLPGRALAPPLDGGLDPRPGGADD